MLMVFHLVCLQIIGSSWCIIVPYCFSAIAIMLRSSLFSYNSVSPSRLRAVFLCLQLCKAKWQNKIWELVRISYAVAYADNVTQSHNVLLFLEFYIVPWVLYCSLYCSLLTRWLCSNVPLFLMFPRFLVVLENLVKQSDPSAVQRRKSKMAPLTKKHGTFGTIQ